MTFTLVVGAAPVAGREPFYRDLLARAAHVVAADAAGEWCAGLGRVPDIVVGDFDGSEAGAQERLRVFGASVDVHPCDKDETDLDLAVSRALAGWEDPVVLTAAFTERIDHTLAALGALTSAGPGARVVEPSWTAYLCRESHPVGLDLPAGTMVSVVTLGREARVSIVGAKWPLRDAALPPLSGRGIGNRATGGPFVVSTTDGTVAIIVQGSEGAAIY